MAVVSVKELARTFQNEIVGVPTAKRRFVCVLSDDTTTGGATSFVEMALAAFGSTQWGQSFPSWPAMRLSKVVINEGYEGSPYHAEVVAEYGLVRDEDLLAPTERPAEFNVEAGQGEVPALYYYDMAGNNSWRPLTNSAFDYFPGLTVEEATARITIKKIFANFPTSWMAAMNAVNSDAYFGMPVHTGKVASVTASPAYEEFNNLLVKYWSATATVVYRQTGHNLQLPDVGFNFIADGQKRRAMVYDFQNDEWLPSPNPIGLNGIGGPSPTGHPAVLVRRVNPETDFATLFGTPPT